MKKPKLICPAGNWPMLVAALNAGADAVYFGVKQLNMRITAQNFEISELKKIADFCHKHNAEAYLTLNTIIYENELEKTESIIKQAKKAGIDAIICWDFSVIKLCRKHKLRFHISTQASVSNSAAAIFYKKLGAEMIVAARECTLEQLKEIKQRLRQEIRKHDVKHDMKKQNERQKAEIRIEAFVHGAMCVSVSGRCFTSQFLFGKSANRGDCLQPCRREYIVTDEEGNQLKLKNNFVMSAKDLCTLPFIEKLIEAGIDAFKIEGRYKSPEYVKIVTEAYRKAIDAYFEKKLTKKLKAALVKNLETVFNRGFSSGFYFGTPINEFSDEYGSKSRQKKEYIGYIKNYFKKVKAAELYVENNPASVGDTIIIIGNKTGCIEAKIASIELNHKKIKKAAKSMNVAIQIDKDDVLRVNDKVFKVVNK